jgi:F-type H+-transporting ATPase subunit c
VAGVAEAMARNPGAAENIRFALILGLVFIETLTIYALALFLFKG